MHFDLRAVALSLLTAGLILAGAVPVSQSGAQEVAGQTVEVDTALVVSVDVSNSVDERRYQLQMGGIASALEDESVIDAILSGPQGGIVIAMVVWADRPKTAIPWTVIRNKEDAAAVAEKIRKLPREGGEFTCVAGMLRNIADKLVTQIPVKASRTVVDVSGDGSENCNPVEPLESIRNELIDAGVTINGLPILDGKEKATLEEWYTANIKGGPSGFVLPANGFEDFPRAIRQKFVIEMSAMEPGVKRAIR
ncbi:MAG: DUF1194 domain-containing protein [Hyphomicrobium sp.]